MRIRVYHLNTDHYFSAISGQYLTDALAKEYMDITCLGKRDVAAAAFQDESAYQAVAVVSWADDDMDLEDALEAAWEMTNNITESWVGLHDNCTALAPAENGCRSSMVGDIFEVDLEDGTEPQLHIVAGVGFKQL